jgi:multiple sugar transport system permease protein
MVAPMMVGWAIFFLVGFVASFGVSLTSWKLLGTPTFVGPDNYLRLPGDSQFLTSLGNTIRLAVLYVPLDLAVALSLAVALNRRIRFRNVYRAIFFLPLLTMPIAAATIWRWLYDPTYGLINAGLDGVGIHGPGWLAESLYAMPAIVVMSVWNGVGRDMVIFLAGLQAIPRDLYEAAEVDGANRWHTFRHITLPLLTPTTFFVIVVSTISSLQVFDAIYVMTNGGPANSTRTVVFTVWEEAFRNNRIGNASAMTWVLVVLILGFTIVQFRAQRRWVHYA